MKNGSIKEMYEGKREILEDMSVCIQDLINDADYDYIAQQMIIQEIEVSSYWSIQYSLDIF